MSWRPERPQGPNRPRRDSDSDDNSKWALPVLAGIAGIAGAGLAYYLSNRNGDGESNETVVVNSARECQQVVRKLKDSCKEFKVLGFDCEWVSYPGARNPVALLQLAAPNGFCALFRLNKIRHVPEPLRELLEDVDFVKVGVESYRDAQYIESDYGVIVGGTLDLRFVAREARCEPRGLAKMAKEHLDIDMPKDDATSDWEEHELSKKQKEYAALDARVAIDLVREFAKRMNRSVPAALNRCSGYIDEPFRNQSMLQSASTNARPVDTCQPS